MRSVEISAKTRKDAIDRALDELGVELHEVEIEILDEGSRGLFGLGARDVRVRVSTESIPDRSSGHGEREEDWKDIIRGRESRPEARQARPARGGRQDRGDRRGRDRQPRAERPAEAGRDARPARGGRDERTRPARDERGQRSERGPLEENRDRAPREESRDRGREGRGGRDDRRRDDSRDPRRGGRNDREQRDPRDDRTEETRGEGRDEQRQPQGERGGRRGRPERREPRGGERDDRAARGGSPGERRDRGPVPAKRVPVTTNDDDFPGDLDDIDREDTVVEAAEQQPVRKREPEDPQVREARCREASSLLQEVIDRMGIKANVTGDVIEEETLLLKVDSEDSAILIGRKGRTLSALQFIINRMIAASEGGDYPDRIVVDVEGYLDRRRESLEDMALHLADKAKQTGRNMRVKPLNPQERRIIHLKLQDDPDIRTFSLGESLYRSVIIAPKSAGDEERPRRGRGGRGGRGGGRWRQPGGPRDRDRDNASGERDAEPETATVDHADSDES